jgi:flagella basal body P-ring formation protein FlgA
METPSRIALLLSGAALLGAAHAAPAPEDPATDAIRRFVTDEVARAQPGLRAEITVGQMDPRLRLAPCDRTEAFLRPGGRLWGRGFVGYRCLQNPGWSVSVPVNVRLYGVALVAVQPLAALQPIAASAVRQDEVEMTREPGGVATDVSQVEDRYSTRAVEPGQPIALSTLRTVAAVGQGDAVKLVGLGSGFQISTDGTALSSAAAGETVRVRTESGHTLAGVARKGRVVEVSF